MNIFLLHVCFYCIETKKIYWGNKSFKYQATGSFIHCLLLWSNAEHFIFFLFNLVVTGWSVCNTPSISSGPYWLEPVLAGCCTCMKMVHRQLIATKKDKNLLKSSLLQVFFRTLSQMRNVKRTTCRKCFLRHARLAATLQPSLFKILFSSS